VKLTVNGREQELDDGSTVRDLLATLGLAGRPVVVEVNRELAPRATHGERRLEPGDRVEIVTLVGGG
jgi:thiamine biosynthesis protein ThiS